MPQQVHAPELFIESLVPSVAQPYRARGVRQFQGLSITKSHETRFDDISPY